MKINDKDNNYYNKKTDNNIIIKNGIKPPIKLNNGK